MNKKHEQRTSRGGFERQIYTPTHDPGVTYQIDHTHTDYYVSLGGQRIADARFPAVNGKDPGWHFTADRAVEVIEAFYTGNHASIHGIEMIDCCSANGLLWRHMRDSVKQRLR